MRCILIRTLILISLVSSLHAASTTNVSSWYSVLLEDKPVGYAHILELIEEGRIISKTEMEISIRRGATTITIKSNEEFKETKEGQPISSLSINKLGFIETYQELHFKPDGILLITKQGSQKQEKTLPLPKEEWMSPAASRRHVEKALARGDTNISYKTIQPSNGPGVIELKMVRIGEQNIEVYGKTVPAIAWEQTMSIMPGMKLKGFVDEKGRDLKSELLAIPGMRMSIVASDEQLAKAKISPPEVMAATLVTVKQPIGNARTLKSGTYLLKSKSPEAAAVVLPVTKYQSVEQKKPGEILVKVDLNGVGSGPQSKPDATFLAATSSLNHEDPKVKELLEKALGPKTGSGAVVKAELIRKFVREFVKSKDMSVGFATASEVARTAQGDCTEHAVLLAALLRGASIPSRTVSGLVYVDSFVGQQNVFGYHMWTQAWLEGSWVDLDAALGDQPFDATHIAMTTSAMAEESMNNDLMKMIPFLGQLSIEVVK